MRKFEEMQQNATEFGRFVTILQRENVRSYLEIGSRLGGTLWRVACALPVPSRIVSLDLPHGNRETEPHLRECVGEIKKLGHDVELIIGDSTDPGVVDRVQAMPFFDAIFIDANHTEPYVRKDWTNYGILGRIVAFHDINWKPRPQPSSKLPIDVPKVWKEIRDSGQFKTEEICLDSRDNGIGIVYR